MDSFFVVYCKQNQQVEFLFFDIITNIGFENQTLLLNGYKDCHFIIICNPILENINLYYT
jgi:hypothetical protein